MKNFTLATLKIVFLTLQTFCGVGSINRVYPLDEHTFLFSQKQTNLCDIIQMIYFNTEDAHLQQ